MVKPRELDRYRRRSDVTARNRKGRTGGLRARSCWSTGGRARSTAATIRRRARQTVRGTTASTIVPRTASSDGNRSQNSEVPPSATHQFANSEYPAEPAVGVSEDRDVVGEAPRHSALLR